MFEETQQEFNRAYLNAAFDGNVGKAMKFLNKGAKADTCWATDGNTALHELAKSFRTDMDGNLKHAQDVQDFVSEVVSRGLDINAKNKLGQTCLHRVAEKSKNERGIKTMAGILRMFGASLDVRDNLGRTPLHAAAYHGAAHLIGSGMFSSLIATQDNEGNYPWQLAQLGGNSALAEQLKQALDAYQLEKTKGEQPPDPVVEKPVEPMAAAPVAEVAAPPSAPKDLWILTEPEEIWHVKIQEALGYKLTEIFNFHTRIYTKITHNLKTKTDAPQVDRRFDDFGDDRTLLEDAFDQQKKKGGVALKESIYKKPEKPQPAPNLPLSDV